MADSYWRQLATWKLWEENTRAVAQGASREVELTAAELLRRTDLSPETFAASAERCAARRAAMRARHVDLYPVEPEPIADLD